MNAKPSMDRLSNGCSTTRAGLSQPLFAKAFMSAEQQFWKWFKAHEDELFHFERDQEPIFDRLADALGEVDDDLTFEFGPKRDGVREFVISAAGLKRAFTSVARLYDARPQLDRFYVTAFRPRRCVVNDIEYSDLRITASDVYYRLCKDDDPQKIGILLFLPGYTEDRRDAFGQAGYLFLDEALGEYDVETNVGFIEIVGHDSKYFDGAFPIQQLATDFDALLQSKKGK